MAIDPNSDSDPRPARGYQRLFLRIMLIALVVGAVVGAALLLAGLYSGGGRVIATCVISAIAAGFMIPVGMWLDDSRRRHAGILGTAVVMLAFLAAMVSVWIDAVIPSPMGSGKSLELLLTSVSIAGIGGVCASLLAVANLPFMRHASRVGIPAGGVCLVVTLFAIWSGYVPGMDDLLVTMLFSWPCLFVAMVNHGRDWRHFRWLGVAAVGALLVDAVMQFTMNGSPVPSAVAYLWATATSVAVTNLLMTLRVPATFGFLRWTAILCLVAAAFLAASRQHHLARYGLGGGDFVVRCIAALTLLGGCSGVGLAVAMRLGATKKWATGTEPYKSLAVSCPRCGKRQSITLPESACGNCSLRFRITMHDDRCPTCGYDTSGLKTSTCPECGGGVLLRSAWEMSAISPPSAALHAQAG